MAKKENVEEDKKTTDSKLKNDNPVIIRREVIVKNSSTKEEKEIKKEEPKKREVGFIDETRKKDYNIVYRNKPTKPMTASELFGINKAAPKKEEQINVKQKEEEVKVPTKPVISKEEIPNNIIRNTNTNVKATNTSVNNTTRNTNINNTNNYTNRKPFNNQNNTSRNYSNNTTNNNGYNNTNRKPFNNQNNDIRNYNNNYNRGPRPLDEKGIDKNIKDIMAVEIVEKEGSREYANKSIDKEKINKYEDAKLNKKATKSKKSVSEDINNRKLKDLKQSNRISNMFEEGSMLDYYDLTTVRGRRNRRKTNPAEKRTKQKIFQLEKIEIPETTTVKELSIQLKKTSSEIIKKLLNYGIMATINNDIDYDTAFLIASEFGINAKKKEIITDEEILFDDSEDKDEDLKIRPPVVVVMGHVDHR